MTDTISAEPAVRAKKLSQWTEAPSARAAHPDEEHLIPLMVAAGAGDTGTRIYNEIVLETAISGFKFA